MSIIESPSIDRQLKVCWKSYFNRSRNDSKDVKKTWRFQLIERRLNGSRNLYKMSSLSCFFPLQSWTLNGSLQTHDLSLFTLVLLLILEKYPKLLRYKSYATLFLILRIVTLYFLNSLRSHKFTFGGLGQGQAGSS